MKTLDGLLDAVPAGEDQACGFRKVWLMLDRGAPSTVKHGLEQLVQAGLIERKTIPFSGGIKHLYFREA